MGVALLFGRVLPWTGRLRGYAGQRVPPNEFVPLLIRELRVRFNKVLRGAHAPEWSEGLRQLDGGRCPRAGHLATARGMDVLTTFTRSECVRSALSEVIR